MIYPLHLETGHKTYFLDNDQGKILSTEKDGFGGTITRVYMESDELFKLEKVWNQFHDIFHYGRRSKKEEIKRALESY